MEHLYDDWLRILDEATKNAKVAAIHRWECDDYSGNFFKHIFLKKNKLILCHFCLLNHDLCQRVSFEHISGGYFKRGTSFSFVVHFFFLQILFLWSRLYLIYAYHIDTTENAFSQERCYSNHWTVTLKHHCPGVSRQELR